MQEILAGCKSAETHSAGLAVCVCVCVCVCEHVSLLSL